MAKGALNTACCLRDSLTPLLDLPHLKIFTDPVVFLHPPLSMALNNILQRFLKGLSTLMAQG